MSEESETIDELPTEDNEPPSSLAGSSEIVRRLSGRAGGYGRYHLRGELARGGMGAILRVWDEDLRRHLAMKVILGRGDPEATGATPPVHSTTLARFLEEAQVTGQLEHPGIVPVHELGLDAQGRVYFTMKLVKGRNLEHIFDLVHKREEGWTQTRAIGVVLKVCEAMAYAHDKGVIHRDLKPANVMVGRFGEVYVMDWGLAKVLGRDDPRDIRIRGETPAPVSTDGDRIDAVSTDVEVPLLTMDGDVLGTPAYMSPEQASGDLDSMGPHSDVYCVGAMLYHLLAGHPPYAPPGAALNNHAVWRAVGSGPPQSLAEIASDVPDELVAVCEKAMAQDTSDRYTDMSGLAEDLRAYVEGRVVHAYERGAWAEARKWVRRNKPLASALASVVVLLIVGLTVSLILKAQSDANAQLAEDNSVLAEGRRQAAERNFELAEQRRREADANFQLAEERRLQAEASEQEARRQESEATRQAQIARDNFQLAEERRVLAEANEQEARRQEQIASQERANVLRLSSFQNLEDLRAAADRLWPARPEQIPAYEAWLHQAAELVGGLDEHRAQLERLRASKEPEPDRFHAESADVSREVVERRWWRAQLVKLIEQIEAFADPQTGLIEGVSPDHGWGVASRLAWSLVVEEMTVTGAEAAQRWAEAIASISNPEACPSYGGLTIGPQVGLLPLGPDPESGLWEFAHVQTGEVPLRRRDGRLVMTERTAVVLVLLPGGVFTMGAQASDPDGPNYDPQSKIDNGPPHEVTLAPFFLSKYEMTQGQWVPTAGWNPSRDNPGTYNPLWNAKRLPGNLLHPVEQVSWHECVRVCEWLGLTLPSEAQWEYGARGGTTSAWSTGQEQASLAGAANLPDRYARAFGGSMWVIIEEWLDDGSTTHARVGSYSPNPFGLHDVHGNVGEWCRDGYDVDFYARSAAVDPVNDPAGSRFRVMRGGTYNHPAVTARSAQRFDGAPGLVDGNLGIRPARALEGEVRYAPHNR